MRSLLIALVALLLLPTPAQAAVEPLPVGPDVDYQLGGPAAVPAQVGIVVRDRADRPVAGRYNVCYVNAFQTQPDERRFWRAHWRLVLKRDGRPVVDSAWGEWLLDTRTPRKRARIAAIVGRWIDGCAASGFDAAELDNLDSWSRSHGLIRPRHDKRLARRLVARHIAPVSPSRRRTGPSGTGGSPGSTSPWPRSADAGTSAVPTSGTTDDACWSWSTAGPTSTPPAHGGGVRWRWCCATARCRRPGSGAGAEPGSPG